MVAHGSQKTKKNIVIQTGQYGKQSQKTQVQLQIMYHKSGKGKITNAENNNREITFNPVFYPLANCVQQNKRTYEQDVSQEKIQSSKPKLLSRERHNLAIKTIRKKCFYSKTDYEQSNYKPIILHLHATLRNKLDWAGDQSDTQRRTHQAVAVQFCRKFFYVTLNLHFFGFNDFDRFVSSKGIRCKQSQIS